MDLRRGASCSSSYALQSFVGSAEMITGCGCDETRGRGTALGGGGEGREGGGTLRYKAAVGGGAIEAGVVVHVETLRYRERESQLP